MKVQDGDRQGELDVEPDQNYSTSHWSILGRHFLFEQPFVHRKSGSFENPHHELGAVRGRSLIFSLGLRSSIDFSSFINLKSKTPKIPTINQVSRVSA